MIEPLSKWLRQFAYQHAQQLIRVWNDNPFVPDGTADLVDPVLILQWDFLLADKDPELLGRCLLYTSPSPRDMRRSRMPSSA